MERHESLDIWLKTLDRETLEKVALECIEECIEGEIIGFYHPYKKTPYWDGNGENIDGSEDYIEDDE